MTTIDLVWKNVQLIIIQELTRINIPHVLLFYVFSFYFLMRFGASVPVMCVLWRLAVTFDL